MNASHAKKTRPVVTVLIASAAVTLGGGCAGRFAPRADQASPLAPRVEQLVEANRRYPRWEDFPAAPTGLPEPAQIAANVQALEADNTALGGEVARIQWTLGDAETLAAETRAQVGAVPVSPDSARTAAEIDAFAQALRERAKAPPPIDRPQPR